MSICIKDQIQNMNIVIGCTVGCTYCYARNNVKRWHMIDDFVDPEFFPGKLKMMEKKRPQNFLLTGMSDLSGWKPEWRDEVFAKIRENPQHQFLFLTKRPDLLDFDTDLENAWFGVTVTRKAELWRIDALRKNVRAKHYHVTFELLFDEIAIERLRVFENHPFRVEMDSQMKDLQDSIKQYGIITPVIVRPRKERYYEIISGHRRIFATEKLGYRKVPTIIRYMTDDQAVIAMVDSNLQRERIQPSEKAFAYKMKYDVLKRKSGRRKAGQVDHNSGKKGLEIISEETGDSPKQVQRYIKMADLIPELLEKVDDGSMGFTPAVQIAYLKKKEQKDVLDAMELTLCTPSLSQAMRMKKLSADGKLTTQRVEDILSEIKQKETDRVVFKNDQLHKYFPKNYSTEQMKREIIELLKLYVLNY